MSVSNIAKRMAKDFLREWLRLDVSFVRTKVEIEKGFRFVRSVPFGPAWTPGSAEPNTINWVVPYFDKGSGGHLNIFRQIGHLEQLGWNIRIIVDDYFPFNKKKDFRKLINEHYLPVRADVGVGRDAMTPAYITMATNWQTAYAVRDFRGTALKGYFVQDFEPYFYTPGSDHAFAEETYRFGFFGLTAGSWLAEKLSAEYGMTTDAIGFSYDRELYPPKLERDPKHKRVFFYARPCTARRGFEMGVLALAELHKRMPDVEILFAGEDVSKQRIPFPYRNLGVAPLSKLADLYHQCDLALVLSFTNLSLLPLELMACGCVVVSNTGPNVEWLLDDDNAVLVPPTVENLSEAMFQQLADADACRARAERALRFTQATDWRQEAEKADRFLRERVRAATNQAA